ncbi:hypothetical protein ACXGQW_09790 [Wenyingzhuangia sp. IMCC45533]
MLGLKTKKLSSILALEMDLFRHLSFKSGEVDLKTYKEIEKSYILKIDKERKKLNLW